MSDSSPVWQDVPTVPGWYVVRDSQDARDFDSDMFMCGVTEIDATELPFTPMDGERFYGPIPRD